MMEIKCSKEYYKKVIDFSKEKGLYHKLHKQLVWLCQYATKDGQGNTDMARTKCELYSDMVFGDVTPTNFTFAMFLRNKEGEYQFWFNGGLIFFQNEQDWSVHT